MLGHPARLSRPPTCSGPLTSRRPCPGTCRPARTRVRRRRDRHRRRPPYDASLCCARRCALRKHEHVIAPRRPSLSQQAAPSRDPAQPAGSRVRARAILVSVHLENSEVVGSSRAPGMEDAAGGRRQQETAAAGASKAQRRAAAAGVSVHEWLQHVKASFIGLVSNVSQP